VVYTWTVDPAYGGGTKRFKGRVSGVSGDFARIVNQNNEVMAIYLPDADIKVVDNAPQHNGFAAGNGSPS
jgi:hypothetical protein